MNNNGQWLFLPSIFRPGFISWTDHKVLIIFCGSSSFGRARPCQGRGGRFEPGLPLTIPSRPVRDGIFCPGGGIGRHAGLKILWPAMAVTVQLRSGAHLIGIFLRQQAISKQHLTASYSLPSFHFFVLQ